MQEYIHFQNLKQLADKTLSRVRDTHDKAVQLDIFDQWNTISGELNWGVFKVVNRENYELFIEEKVAELKILMNRAVDVRDKYSIYQTTYLFLVSKQNNEEFDFRDECREKGFFKEISDGLLKMNRENLNILDEIANEIYLRY